jgi:hypothetical protein
MTTLFTITVPATMRSVAEAYLRWLAQDNCERGFCTTSLDRFRRHHLRQVISELLSGYAQLQSMSRDMPSQTVDFAAWAARQDENRWLSSQKQGDLNHANTPALPIPRRRQTSS